MGRAPRSTAPGSTAPGSTAPGSTAPGSTAGDGGSGRPRPSAKAAPAETATPVGRWPKAQRVRRRVEYRLLQSRGRRLTTRRFVFLLAYRAIADAGAAVTPARLGVTASRKVGNAVVRNRSKRLVRHGFRATRDLWPPGLDVVVIVRHDLGDATLADVVSEWRAAEKALRRRLGEARRDAEHRALATDE